MDIQTFYFFFLVVNIDSKVHKKDIVTTITHSIHPKGTVLKMGWKKGTYITISRSPKEHKTARASHILVKGFILSMDLCSERHSNTKKS